MRLTIIGISSSIRRNSQGHSVIDRDDIFTSTDRNSLIGGIAVHLGGSVLVVQRRALMRRNLRADVHRTGFVVGNFDIGVLQIMMDDVGRSVELEVQLQHQRAVACNFALQHVVFVIRFKDVLAVFLGGLIGVSNGNSRIRGGLTLVAAIERVSTIAILIVELDGVLGVGVRLPDGVEDIITVVVHLHLRVGSNGAFAIGVGVPAHEGIARTGEGVFDGGNGVIIGDGVNLLISALAAVGLIGQGDGRGTRAPHAGEGHIALDLVLIAGLVGVLAIRPAEEVLAVRRNQRIGRHQVGKTVFRILLAIRRSRHAVLAGYVGNGEGAVLGVIGIQGNIVINLGVNIEGVTGAVRSGTPAAPGITGLVLHDRFLKGIQIISNRTTIGNVLDFIFSAANDRGKCLPSKGRLDPLSVDSYCLRRHLPASKNIFVSAFRRIIPAGENIPFLACGRIRIVKPLISFLRDNLLKQVGVLLYLITIVDINNIIAIAGVVEFRAVIVASIRCADIRIACIAINIVALFISNRETTTIPVTVVLCRICMINLIRFPTYGRSGFAGKHFYIISSSGGAATCLLSIEILASNRHDSEIALRSVFTIFIDIPTVARPLVSNKRAVLRGDTLGRILCGSAIIIKSNLIHIALIIHVHDRRAVARDGFLRNSLRFKTIIVFRRRCRGRAGGAVFGFRFRIRIPVIVGVLLPVDDSILSIVLRCPDSIERQRRGKLITERKFSAVFFLRPVGEFIARTGGGGGLASFLATLYKLRSNIAAFLRIKGDPVAVLNSGLKGHVAAVQRDRGYEVAACVLPADDGFLIADGIGHALRGNRVADLALLCDHDFALRIGEEHEVHVLIVGIIGERLRFGNGHLVAKGSELVAAFLGIIPTNELLVRAVRFRRAGVVERFVVLENLAGELLRAIHKDIGNSSHRRLHDALQRNAGAGLRAAGDGHDGRQRVHGRAADEHENGHQQGKTPTKLVFHKKLILPMKFR